MGLDNTSALGLAHKKLFSHRLRQMPHWKMAKDVLDNFDVRVLGEDLALKVLCEVILYTFFPDLEERTKCIGKAEEKLPEILGVNCDHEFHMAEVEYIWRELVQKGKTASDISKLFATQV